jgi:hypothetical protein
MTLEKALPYESVTWAAGYSLEFLLGVEVFHEQFGTGRVYAVNDEQLTCSVCFKGAIHIELSALSLNSLKRPLHIDAEELLGRFHEYRTRVDALQRGLADAQREVDDLESKLRWMSIFKVCFAPKELAILVSDDEAQSVH